MRMMTGRKVGQECAATELLWNANANNDDKGSICVRVHRNVRLSIDNGLGDQTLIAITAQITTMRQGKEHSIICSADGIDYLHNPATMGLKEKTRNGIYPNAHQEYLRTKEQTERSIMTLLTSQLAPMQFLKAQNWKGCQ